MKVNPDLLALKPGQVYIVEKLVPASQTQQRLLMPAATPGDGKQQRLVLHTAGSYMRYLGRDKSSGRLVFRNEESGHRFWLSDDVQIRDLSPQENAYYAELMAKTEEAAAENARQKEIKLAQAQGAQPQGSRVK